MHSVRRGLMTLTATVALATLVSGCPADEDKAKDGAPKDAVLPADSGPPDGPPGDQAPPGDITVPDFSPACAHLVGTPPSAVYHPVGDFTLAAPAGVQASSVAAADPAKREVAQRLDYPTAAHEVAGFVVARPTEIASLRTVLNALLSARLPVLVGTGEVPLILHSSGRATRSHGGYEALEGISLRLIALAPVPVTQVRELLLALLLGRTPTALGDPPATFGAPADAFEIRLSFIKQVDLANSDDLSKWRMLMVGAVAAVKAYEDPARVTGQIVDDLTDGTALVVGQGKLVPTCDRMTIDALPAVDFIWVVDESMSMDPRRAELASEATDFFSRALWAGLDFRMGVTGMCDPAGPACPDLVGKLCSEIAALPDHDGGDDRFILPSEMATFVSCVKNPPGQEVGSEYGLTNASQAFSTHLPRADQPDRIRPTAHVAIIVATDEMPAVVQDVLPFSDFKTCDLSAAPQNDVDLAVAPLLNVLAGASDPQARATLHVIGGACNNKCNADQPHGYVEVAAATGGLHSDICAPNLGRSLNLILADAGAAAWPTKLSHRALSSSVAVDLDGAVLPRSRAAGFEYHAAHRAVVLLNTAFSKGSELLAYYHYWY